MSFDGSSKTLSVVKMINWKIAVQKTLLYINLLWKALSSGHNGTSRALPDNSYLIKTIKVSPWRYAPGTNTYFLTLISLCRKIYPWRHYNISVFPSKQRFKATLCHVFFSIWNCWFAAELDDLCIFIFISQMDEVCNTCSCRITF